MIMAYFLRIDKKEIHLNHQGFKRFKHRIKNTNPIDQLQSSWSLQLLAKRTCTNCGAAASADESICLICGAKLIQPMRAHDPSDSFMNQTQRYEWQHQKKSALQSESVSPSASGSQNKMKIRSAFAPTGDGNYYVDLEGGQPVLESYGDQRGGSSHQAVCRRNTDMVSDVNFYDDRFHHKRADQQMRNRPILEIQHHQKEAHSMPRDSRHQQSPRSRHESYKYDAYRGAPNDRPRRPIRHQDDRPNRYRELDAYEHRRPRHTDPRYHAPYYDDRYDDSGYDPRYRSDRYDRDHGDYVDYKAHDLHDRYDNYADDYEDYRYRYATPNYNVGRIVLTILLVILAVAVVIGIVHIIKNLVEQPPIPANKISLQSVPSISPVKTTTPTIKRPSAPSTSTTTAPPSTTTTTQISQPSSSVPSVSQSLAPPANGSRLKLKEAYVLREAPDKNSRKLTAMPPGSMVNIIATVEGEAVDGYGHIWYKISYNGQQGYMIKDPKGQQ